MSSTQNFDEQHGQFRPSRESMRSEAARFGFADGRFGFVEAATVADPTLGIAAYLTTELGAVTGGTIAEGLRVFRPQLPEEEQANMPRACVVVVPSGGGHLFGRVRYGIMDDVIDLNCFGSTRLEAENLGRRVARAMRTLSQSRWEGVTLRWARIAGRPVAEIDKESNWPVALVTVQVAFNEMTD